MMIVKDQLIKFLQIPARAEFAKVDSQIDEIMQKSSMDGDRGEGPAIIGNNCSKLMRRGCIYRVYRSYESRFA